MSLISNMSRIVGSPTPPGKVFLPTTAHRLSRDQAVEGGPKPWKYRPFFGAVPNQRVLCNVPLAGFQETAQ